MMTSYSSPLGKVGRGLVLLIQTVVDVPALTAAEKRRVRSVKRGCRFESIMRPRGCSRKDAASTGWCNSEERIQAPLWCLATHSVNLMPVEL